MQILSKELTTEGYLMVLSGEFDAEGCRQIRDELETAASDCAGNTLMVDLYDVSFIDSSGVGAIVFLFKRLVAAKGELQIINVRGQPRELLTLLRVNEAIPVSWYENEDPLTQVYQA